MSLNSKNKKELLKIIEQQILDTEQAIEGLKESSKPVKLDQQGQGRVSRIDAIQQQQMNLASLKRMEIKLPQLKKAIERIDSEDFGLCLACEEEISFERLKVRPESQICIRCSKRK